MKIGEEKEVTINLAPHTLESLEEAAEKRGMSLPVFIRMVLNEWALRYEQLRNKKDR